MIGVVADPADHTVVCEFFELFKTPWEFYRADRQYDVLLCAGDGQIDVAANLVVCYTGRKIRLDEELKTKTGRESKQPCILSFRGSRIPIYGATVTFQEKGSVFLTTDDSRECAGYIGEINGVALARIGYDLFDEIHTLLTEGQPVANANVPALELHITLLRDVITECGITLVEIPPAPEGYPFVACLTHDVDHPSIRLHKFDATMFGFLYRAIFGSLRNFIRGRLPFGGVLKNWAAVLKLPFVYLGLVKDFWREFDANYLDVENGLRSTFFVIPFKKWPGKNASRQAPALRGAGYGAQDISGAIQKLTTAGCEVGLHGIDAWCDSTRGREEAAEIRRLSGASEIGVRMHWLYFEKESPTKLEAAGFTYDSTVGYNGTVGYRAGTTQVYKPLDAAQLLELPLHAMDTALFYPTHLGLSPRQAITLVEQLVENASTFGGALTINWHDRSLAPERLWGTTYRYILQELEKLGAWFATAEQAVAWFRKRRAAFFETDPSKPGAVRVRLVSDHGDKLPGLRLRTHKPRNSQQLNGRSLENFIDTRVNESVVARISSEARR
jgi:hypothetical protein